jgi:FkbM family methyltransferase
MSALKTVMQMWSDARQFGLSFVLALQSNAKADFLDVATKDYGVLRVRPRDSDVWTLRQIFIRREYDIERFKHGPSIRARYDALVNSGVKPVIIDAGANIGGASLWFAKRFPNAMIVALEPDPASAALCRFNIRALPNVTFLERAVGSSSGNVQLSTFEGHSWGSRTARASDGSGGIEICTIDEAVNTAGKDAKLFIAKIDIEGFESELFSENLGWLQSADVVIIEPHDWIMPGAGTSKSFRAVLGDEFDMLILADNLVFVRTSIISGTSATPPPEEPPARTAKSLARAAS